MSNSRHSYTSVSRFFPAMQAVLDARDTKVSIIEVNPKSLGLGPSTCAARLRDAIQAVKGLLVVAPMDHIALTNELQYWIVTNDDFKVQLIHQERRRLQLAAEQSAKLIVEIKGPTSITAELQPGHVQALCLLLDARILEGEYRVRFSDRIDVELLRQQFDVAIIDNQDGTHTIV